MFLYPGFSRISRIPRNSFFSCRWFQSLQPGHHPKFRNSNGKVLGFRDTSSRNSSALCGIGHQMDQQRSCISEDQVEPFLLVADELSFITKRLRSMVDAEVPKLASAAGYFFKVGVEGKMLRPTVLLLMATALNVCIPGLSPDGVRENSRPKLHTRQQCIAEITEMIHVASLMHDDVLDDANTRRGIGSLSFVMGDKLAVLAGNLLIARAVVALASLKNTEAVSLMATAIKNLVSGENMQMIAASEQRFSMEYYLQKSYYKTASLFSNSCKAAALLNDQSEEVAALAFEYGKNLGLAYQLTDDILDFTGTLTSLGKGSLTDIRHGNITAPILFAMEEFPQLREVVNLGFDNPANVDCMSPELISGVLTLEPSCQKLMRTHFQRIYDLIHNSHFIPLFLQALLPSEIWFN